MKLAYAVHGWYDYGWEDYLTHAEELGFSGLELHDELDAALFEKEGPFHKYSMGATVRALSERRLSIVNLALQEDLAALSEDDAAALVEKWIDFASPLHIPFVSLKKK